ncbi:MAG: hypothetical protein ACYTFA_13390 [Planctomycetota bacterium]
MSAEYPSELSESLAAQLERIMDCARVDYGKEQRDEPRPTFTYDIRARAGVDLRLSISLTPDTLCVDFNGCYTMVEYGAYLPKFGTNPDAFADWERGCLELVERIIGSDLKIVTRTRGGRLLGGYLYTRSGSEWVSCGGGGSLFMLFGAKHEREYSDWQR